MFSLKLNLKKFSKYTLVMWPELSSIFIINSKGNWN